MNYVSPVKDTKFVLENLLNNPSVIENDLMNSILEEAGKLANENLAPLNHEGDKNPPKLRQDNEVETSPGFKNAFKKIASGGWIGVSSNPDYDGMGLPFRMAAAVSEYWQGANMSFALCNLLSQGLIDALTLVGTDKEKELYLPKLINGSWTGTMNLTEPQSGTDLSTIKTKAVNDGKNWRIKGQKIYITYGEHDFSENIIHLVLAKTEGAPDGIKGISTFIIPKYLINDDGSLGERNDLKCISLEHKLGIKASPTAVMSYGDDKEGAIGYMLGEEGKGIEYMFIMMNRARFDVGLQGMAIAETARQKAIQYAKTRVQGIPLNKTKGTPIIGHGDVKRQLLIMRSLTEAMRALILVSAEIMEEAEKEKIKMNLEAFLIPIIKGWCTELAQEVTSLGVQIHGGMGYIEETGAAQIMRDARILPIYEGTNAIQANDLMFRKTLKDSGETAQQILTIIKDEVQSDEEILQAVYKCEEVLGFILNNRDDKEALSCISYDFMMGFGYLIGAWLMQKSKIKAEEKINNQNEDSNFLMSKIISSNFYNKHILPRCFGHFDIVLDGSKIISETEEEFV